MRKQRSKAEILPFTHKRTQNAIWKVLESTCSASSTPLSHSKHASHRQVCPQRVTSRRLISQWQTQTHRHWVRNTSRLIRANKVDLEHVSQTAQNVPVDCTWHLGQDLPLFPVIITSPCVVWLIGPSHIKNPEFSCFKKNFNPTVEQMKCYITYRDTDFIKT